MQNKKLRSKKVGTSQCTKKIKREGHSKINEQIKLNIYAWIKNHPQVLQSPISNYCIKFMSDEQKELQLVP